MLLIKSLVYINQCDMDFEVFVLTKLFSSFVSTYNNESTPAAPAAPAAPSMSRFPLPHCQLVGTPNASLSHSPQTVGPHATCHLPPTDY